MHNTWDSAGGDCTDTGQGLMSSIGPSCNWISVYVGLKDSRNCGDLACTCDNRFEGGGTEA